jgi:serine/threonine protein kinase
LKLGEGYYGVVYYGKYLGNEVAIKKLKQNIPENVIEKFVQEVNILSNIDHPNVVKYIGAILEEDLFCIVTEFMNSGNLWDYIHNKNFQFTETMILKVSMDITSAMEYLHHLKPMIIHRDLKSPNILCNRFDNQSMFSCKVADFGLSRFFESSIQQQMTKGIGTAAWSAPGLKFFFFVFYLFEFFILFLFFLLMINPN